MRAVPNKFASFCVRREDVYALAIGMAALLLAAALEVHAGHADLPLPALTFSHPREQTLALSFQHGFGTQAVTSKSEYQIDAQRTVRLSRVAYLLSGFRLQDRQQRWHELPEQYAFISASDERTTATVFGVPQGQYAAIEFTIGLPEAVNHGDPSRYPPDHPLHPLLNRLHWGWKGGYVAFALEGHTSSKGQADKGLLYHLGGTQHRVTVALPVSFRYPEQAAVALRADLRRLFVGADAIDVRVDNSTHSREGDRTAVRLRAALTQVFSMATATATAVGQQAGPPSRPRRQVQRAAGSESQAEGVAQAYAWRQPDHFPIPKLPADNPLTQAGVALGEALFRDPLLSQDRQLSCASCHLPGASFSDAGQRVSRGTGGAQGHRNTMPLFNLAWSPSYAWDGRNKTLRAQALAPLLDRRELNLPFDTAVKRLAQRPDYRAMFRAAFGGESIGIEQVGLALEQYLLTLVSAGSKFDAWLRGATPLSEQEERGLALFTGEFDPARGQFGADCFHCHGGNLFSQYDFRNNGLVDRPADRGREGQTGNRHDRNLFKTPSLRNIAVTGPYMHDGRLATLEAVVEHYASGVVASATLDPALAKHAGERLRLSAADKAALVAFMKTLTDPAFSPAAGNTPRRTAVAAKRSAPAARGAHAPPQL